MRSIDRLKGSRAKWYLLGIASAVAAGWVSHEPNPPPPLSESPVEAAEALPSSEAIELVHTARALELTGDSVQARASYLAAASQLSPIGDYLRLRAAHLTTDSSGRRKLYDAVTSRPARDQVGPIEARVREKLGDLSGAVQERTRLGHVPDVFRLRLDLAGDESSRPLVLKDLVAWVADSARSPQRDAVAAQALPFTRDLSIPDLLMLARGTTAGPSSPAPAFFERAKVLGARFTAADNAAWGEALYARGRYREAVGRLRRVTSGTLLPRSMLLRGRAMLRSGQPGGKAVLDELVRRFPTDSTVVPTALFLLGDLARDARDYGTAGLRWRLLGERFPESAEAPRALFLIGLIQYVQGHKSEAAKVWDSLFLSDRGKEEALAGGYWSGRARLEQGDTSAARARWRQVIGRSRLSYYSRLAFRRLGLTDTTLSSGQDTFADPPGLQKARQRLNLLVATGLTTELGQEMTWLASQAGEDPAHVLGTASLLRERHRAAYSAQLGWRALAGGAAESRTYRLIFPLMFEAPLIAAAHSEGVEPALAAALIRQESLFDSMAVSRAGARGLMQIMPSVGRELARSARKRAWHPDSLFQPMVNLELGTSHLAWALSRYGGLERTLAAYNAGGSRVTRWARYPGSSDSEVFVEWIPFPETRTYVRTVMRNLEFYRGLYAWQDPG